MGVLNRQVWGACLVCIGAAILYGSGDAIQNYFVTGQIAWGRPSRRLEGEMALMAHGLFFLVGFPGSTVRASTKVRRVRRKAEIHSNLHQWREAIRTPGTRP